MIYIDFLPIHFYWKKNYSKDFLKKLLDASYKIQSNFTKTLPLIIYPDCEECSQDVDAIATKYKLY
jgi:hypothetical protein